MLNSLPENTRTCLIEAWLLPCRCHSPAWAAPSPRLPALWWPCLLDLGVLRKGLQPTLDPCPQLLQAAKLAGPALRKKAESSGQLQQPLGAALPPGLPAVSRAVGPLTFDIKVDATSAAAVAALPLPLPGLGTAGMGPLLPPVLPAAADGAGPSSMAARLAAQGLALPGLPHPLPGQPLPVLPQQAAAAVAAGPGSTAHAQLMELIMRLDSGALLPGWLASPLHLLPAVYAGLHARPLCTHTPACLLLRPPRRQAGPLWQVQPPGGSGSSGGEHGASNGASTAVPGWLPHPRPPHAGSGAAGLANGGIPRRRAGQRLAGELPRVPLVQACWAAKWWGASLPMKVP